MRRVVSFCTYALLFASACVLDAVPSQNAFIQCADDNECPDNWFCTTENLCSPPDVVAPQTAPVTSIQSFDTERRYFRNVPFDLGVLDLNASAEDPESIRLEIEYIVDQANDSILDGLGDPRWWSGTLIYEAPAILTEPSLQTSSVIWNAVSDTDLVGIPEFISTQVDDVGDGREIQIVAFVPSMRLRVRAIDDENNVGPWTSTPSFALGNEVPVVSNIKIPTGVLSGLVPIAFSLSDSSSDNVDIAVQFRLRPDGDWRDANIALGETRQVLADPEPREYVLVWDSHDALRGDVTTAQGIGQSRQDTIEVRIRASDTPAAAVIHHARWQVAPEQITVDNR